MAGPSSVPVIRYDLAHYGAVTSVVNATTFRAAAMAGQGNGAFQGYEIYVLKKNDGSVAAPHGEQRPCTVYVSANGSFAHTAFTASLEVGDAVLLLHPSIVGFPESVHIPETSGGITFDESSALEQAAFTLLTSRRIMIGGIWLDMVNATQAITIAVYHQIDGVNYRVVESHRWATTDSDGVLITGFTAFRNVQVTLICTGGGAGNILIPYAVV